MTVNLFAKAIVFLLVTAGAVLPQEISHRTGPKIIRRVNPGYTKEAWDAKLQGTVVLSFVVAVDGMPSEIKVVRGLGSGLDEKAVECLQQWRFTPATRNGEPVPEKVTLEMNFRIGPGVKPTDSQ
jgi:TonB family protein